MNTYINDTIDKWNLYDERLCVTTLPRNNRDRVESKTRYYVKASIGLTVTAGAVTAASLFGLFNNTSEKASPIGLGVAAFGFMGIQGGYRLARASYEIAVFDEFADMRSLPNLSTQELLCMESYYRKYNFTILYQNIISRDDNNRINVRDINNGAEIDDQTLSIYSPGLIVRNDDDRLQTIYIGDQQGFEGDDDSTDIDSM